MRLKLYNTLTRRAEPVRPIDGRNLRFYCCGPTVYGPAHIGNFRTFVMQDVLRRVLEVIGQPCTHVRNLTDVDDKTIRQSVELDLPLAEITAQWTARFHTDCAALNLQPPHIGL
jgi:cysteinyl-tRNA synthetase